MQIGRDAVGRIAHERLSPQLSRRFQYSEDDYLTGQAVSANESPLFTTRFDYDAVGNLTRRSDSHYGTDVYQYDPLGRITEHLDPQGRVTRYLNDPAGDRLKTRIVEGGRRRVVGGGVEEGKWSREGEYEGTYYRFDRAGNLVERRDGERDLHLVWDGNQRLVESHAEGLVTRYGYDPLGRRLFKETGNRRTLFYWDGDALFAHGHRRRSPDGGGYRPPGLYTLCRTCSVEPSAESIEGMRVTPAADEQQVFLVASVPLTDEDWQPLDEGEIVVVSDGASRTRVEATPSGSDHSIALAK